MLIDIGVGGKPHTVSAPHREALTETSVVVSHGNLLQPSNVFEHKTKAVMVKPMWHFGTTKLLTSILLSRN